MNRVRDWLRLVILQKLNNSFFIFKMAVSMLTVIINVNCYIFSRGVRFTQRGSSKMTYLKAMKVIIVTPKPIRDTLKPILVVILNIGLWSLGVWSASKSWNYKMGTVCMSIYSFVTEEQLQVQGSPLCQQFSFPFKKGCIRTQCNSFSLWTFKNQ